jgi:hypothetical protein
MARTSAFARQIDIVNSQLRGPARQALMVQAAKSAFGAAQAQNHAVLGHDAPFVQIVDGGHGAPLESVKAGGTIVYLFAVGAVTLNTCVDVAIELILGLSPVKSGQFRDRNLFMVNGIETSADREINATAGGTIELRDTDVVSLTNLLPYARKIEKGESLQAPNGVYEAVAAVLRARYGNLLNIRFSYEVYPGYEVGSSRNGGNLVSRKDLHRAAAYPTITVSAK